MNTHEVIDKVFGDHISILSKINDSFGKSGGLNMDPSKSGQLMDLKKVTLSFIETNLLNHKIASRSKVLLFTETINYLMTMGLYNKRKFFFDEMANIGKHINKAYDDISYFGKGAKEIKKSLKRIVFVLEGVSGMDKKSVKNFIEVIQKIEAVVLAQGAVNSTIS